MYTRIPHIRTITSFLVSQEKRRWIWRRSFVLWPIALRWKTTTFVDRFGQTNIFCIVNIGLLGKVITNRLFYTLRTHAATSSSAVEAETFAMIIKIWFIIWLQSVVMDCKKFTTPPKSWLSSESENVCKHYLTSNANTSVTQHTNTTSHRRNGLILIVWCEYITRVKRLWRIMYMTIR